MSVIEVFHWFSQYLIELMFVGCVLALALRFFAHRANKANQAYFNSFSRSIVKHLEEEEAKHESVNDVDEWLENLLNELEDHLPDRSLRFKRQEVKRTHRFNDYTDGKRSIILALKQQADALRSPHPPNFSELADRVLNQDKTWRNVFKILPVDSLNRGLDILPNLFIVGGIFGTFIGITNALPLIASIDISNLSEATPVLNKFVSNVAYSMNTSIAGIVYSVIMTIVTTLFPLGTIREDVAKNFERAIEFMWYRIHGTKLSHGDYLIIQTLKETNATLIKTIRELEGADQQTDEPPTYQKGA